MMAEGASATLERHGAHHLEHRDLATTCCRRCCADLREAFPQIAIELVPSDSVENLLLREADIAVRMFRPTQLELITRKLGEMPDRRLRPRELPRAPRHAASARATSPSTISSASTAPTC